MPLKILHLTSTRYGIGGVEKLLLDMADKYDPNRFSVAYCNLFCDSGGDGRFPSALRQRGLPYFSIRGRRWKDLPALAAGLVSLLRRGQFDVLHTHMLQATLVGQMAARIARVPLTLITRHYTEEAQSNKGVAVRSLDRFWARKATHVIAVSRLVREHLLKKDRVRPERVTVIHNGIDLRAFDTSEEIQPLPWDNSQEKYCLLGCVASLYARKGHIYLIHALAQVLTVYPNVRLVVVGEGPERIVLERLANELRISDRVLFAGFQSNVPALMRRFDLYIQPSVYEPFGIAVLEAMAARKAVVATAVGGIPDIVVNGETGLLVPASDSLSLAAAILQLVHDPALARRMGDRGRRRAEQKFTVEATVNNYQELYNRCAKSACSQSLRGCEQQL